MCFWTLCLPVTVDVSLRPVCLCPFDSVSVPLPLCLPLSVSLSARFCVCLSFSVSLCLSRCLCPCLRFLFLVHPPVLLRLIRTASFLRPPPGGSTGRPPRSALSAGLSPGRPPARPPPPASLFHFPIFQPPRSLHVSRPDAAPLSLLAAPAPPHPTYLFTFLGLPRGSW